MRQSEINRKSNGSCDELGWTYLIQRLKKPFKSTGPLAGLENAFAFGGGLQNGGLSPDAMTLLNDVFRFDYMGSAEFEWGAVPAALEYIAKNTDSYKAFSFEIKLAFVAKAWKDDSPQDIPGTKKIYIICQDRDDRPYVDRILGWAEEGYNRNLKETTRLSDTLRPVNEWDGEVQGWLDLNNGVLFFTDEDMWRKTCELFGIDITE